MEKKLKLSRNFFDLVWIFIVVGVLAVTSYRSDDLRKILENDQVVHAGGSLESIAAEKPED